MKHTFVVTFKENGDMVGCFLQSKKERAKHGDVVVEKNLEGEVSYRVFVRAQNSAQALFFAREIASKGWKKEDSGSTSEAVQMKLGT